VGCQVEGMASLFSAATRMALNPVRRVREKEADHIGHYVWIAISLQNRIDSKTIRRLIFLKDIKYN